MPWKSSGKICKYYPIPKHIGKYLNSKSNMDVKKNWKERKRDENGRERERERKGIN